MIIWNDRNPFYLTGSIFLLASIVLSIVMTFQTNHIIMLIIFLPEKCLKENNY